MIYHTERNEAHEKAVRFVQGFKTNNQNTTEKVISYDPVMKVWTFKKVTIDENAKAYYDATRPAKRELPRTASEPKVKKFTKTIKRQDICSQLSQEIYNRYCEGEMSKDLQKVYNISGRKMRAIISENNNRLGVEQANRKNPMLDKVREALKTTANKAEIARKLGVLRTTVTYHARIIEKELQLKK